MKTCKEHGCPYPVFGKEYCKFHQYLREDYKKTHTLKRTTIKKKAHYKTVGNFMLISLNKLAGETISQEMMLESINNRSWIREAKIGYMPLVVTTSTHLKVLDILFYHYYWAKYTNHQCAECGRPLYEMSIVYMDHILEKGMRRYRHLRYEDENMQYLCSSCYGNKTNGKISPYIQKVIDQTIVFFANKKLI